MNLFNGQIDNAFNSERCPRFEAIIKHCRIPPHDVVNQRKNILARVEALKELGITVEHMESAITSRRKNDPKMKIAPGLLVTICREWMARNPASNGTHPRVSQAELKQRNTDRIKRCSDSLEELHRFDAENQQQKASLIEWWKGFNEVTRDRLVALAVDRELTGSARESLSRQHANRGVECSYVANRVKQLCKEEINGSS